LAEDIRNGVKNLVLINVSQSLPLAVSTSQRDRRTGFGKKEFPAQLLKRIRQHVR